MSNRSAQIAIVDFGLGNMFSVMQACQKVGLSADITSSGKRVLESDGVILPGVGAFGDAIANLTRLDLVGPLLDFAATGKPLVGICLGMQLLMTESYEFGRHRGLGLIDGEVVPLKSSAIGDRTLKVPQIGWNRINPALGAHTSGELEANTKDWRTAILEGVPWGEYMYFVHSYYAQPVDSGMVVSTTKYGATEFCSSLSLGNIFACQFHPERSGPQGLRIYNNLAACINNPDFREIQS